jgi:hypothetical protein
MLSQLEKAINLARKTGDRLIIFDNIRSDNGYVVMGWKDYENLILGRSEVRGLTEDELLDKINRDIAIWKSEQELAEDYSRYSEKYQEILAKMDFPDADDANSADSKDYKKENKRSAWLIPKIRKEAAEEVIEEDRHYLEEVAY